ncbi:MAG: hypothetical protein AMS15_04070 [Planctomycetes bacterium DG_23]|nr:MAG: hypothetical protein AMS15_04070 [Planctomycetes bacterium DG_23]
MLSWENTFEEIRAAKPEIAILPIGAIEQHSYHLPIGTDFLSVTHLARKVAEELDAFLLPTLPYSNSQEHQDFAGTIWIKPATLAQVIKDIVHALKHHGIRKIVCMNGHGGNWIIKPTVREINLSDPEVMVIWSGPGRSMAEGAGRPEELHSGDGETSRGLYLYPHLVKEKRIDHIPEEGREFLDYVGIGGTCPDGVWGKPSQATAEKGKERFEAAIKANVEYIRETFARLDAIEKSRKK